MVRNDKIEVLAETVEERESVCSATHSVEEEQWCAAPLPPYAKVAAQELNTI